MISFLLTISNEPVGEKPTTFMELVVSYRLALLLCSENSPFTFYPSKGVNLELCLSSQEAQLGRRCLDSVLNPFSQPSTP